MKAHYLQHVPFEGLGYIERWLRQRGAAITATRFFQPLEGNNQLPGLDSFDFLIIMGGPMSVNDEADLPWLVQEKSFVRAAVAAGKPVLGVCLGAQLIAASLGAKVYPNGLKEIGWWPVYGKDASVGGFSFPASLHVFHWHGETFDLPPGATLLASSNGCINQAFALEEKVVGLQFHMETTPGSAAQLVENCRDELVEGPCIQPEIAILATEATQYDQASEVLGQLLETLAGDLA